MDNLKHLQKEWYKINEPTGRAFGYPSCCIKEFGNQPPELLKITKPSKNDKLRYKAGCISEKFTGFIPCYSHAKKIITGEITLSSLIKNRNSNLPIFPKTI